MIVHCADYILHLETAGFHYSNTSQVFLLCVFRARQVDDGSLRIEKVQVADDGVYVCVAENSAGTVEAVGRLSVQSE